MSDILLQAANLSHSFDYPLYDHVDVVLREGESVAVQGRSGSGKSTLLHSLAGFLPPLDGVVEVLGEDVYTLDNDALERLRRDELGIVFQAHYLFKGMTGRQNIEAATILAGTSIDEWLLKRLEIDDVVDQKVSELSGGQQQRVSVARVLSKKPKLIFADEPTGNLDKQTAGLVMDVLQEYIRKVNGGLFLVTHDASIAQRCEQHLVLEDKGLRQI
jgi:putative ABC transport system ATP-binding protein